MTRPLLLDLFCGAGGASVGYHRAGFDVVGVDIVDQPNYPFEFHQLDAMDVLEFGIPNMSVEYFDAVHASPPCQSYSAATSPERRALHPDLLPVVRDRLYAQPAPWVIENVPDAPMRADFRLCGCHFGLELRRERWFETSWNAFNLRPPHHHPHPVPSVAGHGTPQRVRGLLPYIPTVADWRASMGIDWMTRDELAQAIPPAYTEHIGLHLLSHLEVAA